MVIYKRKRNISLNYFGGTQKDDSIIENVRTWTSTRAVRPNGSWFLAVHGPSLEPCLCWRFCKIWGCKCFIISISVCSTFPRVFQSCDSQVDTQIDGVSVYWYWTVFGLGMTSNDTKWSKGHPVKAIFCRKK